MRDLDMGRAHLRAIRINQQIGNFSKMMCETCGREVDVYDNNLSRDKWLSGDHNCEECSDNL